MAEAKRTRADRPDAVAHAEGDGSRAAGLAATVIAQDLKAGDVVGEYRLCEELGAGSFGRVFRAVHTVLGRDVAIKILRSAFAAHEQIHGRFVAEARAVNRVRHPNIVDVHAFGTLDDGRPYYVMDLVPGRPLSEVLAGGKRLPYAEALKIVRPLAQALAAAHAHDITHRDLKPENVYLRRDATGETPMLLDFGIALIPDHIAPGRPQTQAGMVVGTPCYMAPEQALGDPVDARADVFALGVLLYRMTTGQLPWDGRSLSEVLRAQLHGPPPSWPMPQAEDVPASARDAILWMLCPEPAQRCPDPLTAVDALEGTRRRPARTSDMSTREERGPAAGQAIAVTDALPAASSADVDAMPLLSRLAEDSARSERSGTRRLLGVLLLSAALFAGAFGGLQLRSQRQSPSATFVFEGRPANLEVVSPEGRVLGRVPGRISVAREVLPLTVLMRAPGHRSQSRTLTVRSSEVQLVTLEPER